MLLRILLAALTLSIAACGGAQGSSACTNHRCGDWCDTCVTGSGTTCQPVQGICDSSGTCRTGFDPASTDPAACKPCNGQACALSR
jgi:hypothetical protein